MKHFAKNVVVVGALLALGAFAMWVLLRPRLPRGDGFTDGEQLVAATRMRAELRLARWEPPAPADNALRAGSRQSDPFVDPASGRVFFVVGDAASGQDLWLATPLEGGGLATRPLTELNSPRRETAPAFCDGWLYFASDRAGGQGGLDLWRSALSGERFLPPENLGAPVNGSADDTDPAPRPGSDELWFATNRRLGGTGDFDLVTAKGDGQRFGAPETAASVQTPYDELGPAFTPDGRVLVFASSRPGGRGGFDLWRALWRDGAFRGAQNLGVPNGTGDESGPTLADGGFTLWFAAAAEATAASDLFLTRTRELFPVEAPRFTLADFTVLLLLTLVALLAWLARRWEALDILWKCMVVSLLVHLLFLWYSRRVNVEPEAAAITASGGDTYEVLLEGDLLRELARLEDRAQGESVEGAGGGGELTTAALERSSLLPAAEERGPGEVAASVERAEVAEGRTAPVAAGREFERAAGGGGGTRDPVGEVTESYERLAGDAAGVALAATSSDIQAPELHGTSGAAFASLASGGLGGGGAGPEIGPAGAPARFERTTAGDAGAAAAVAAVARRSAPGGTRERGEALPSEPVATATPTDRASSGAGGGPGGDGTSAATAPGLALAPAETEAATGGGGSGTGGGGAGGGSLAAGRPGNSLGTPDASPQPEARIAGGRGGSGASSGTGSVDGVGAGPTRSESGPRDPSARTVMSPLALAAPRDGSAGGNGADGASGSGGAGGASPGLGLAPLSASGTGSGALLVSGPGRAALRVGDGRGESAKPSLGSASSAGGDGLARADAAAVSSPARRATDVAGPGGDGDGRAGDDGGATAVALRTPDDRSTTTTTSGTTGSSGSPGSSGAGGNGAAGFALAPATTFGAAARTTGPGRGLGSGPVRAAVGAAAPEVGPAGAAPLPAAEVTRGSDVGSGSKAPGTAPRLYERRFGDAKTVALKEGGGSLDTERAVLAGLRYLAGVQRAKGFFGDAADVDLGAKYRDIRVGKTALCVLAFLGAGHTQQSGGEFSGHVTRALDWILSKQDPASGHFGNSEAYSHGIATYALAECYAMTKDVRLRAPLERAVAHLLAMQQLDTGDARVDGGWTYYYVDGPGFDEYPRASISAWQVMALESAKVGGLEVPEPALAAARTFFLGCWDRKIGGFRYTHNPSWLSNGYGTLPASTPASMFALSLLGEKTHASVAASEKYLLDRLPNGLRERSEDAFVRRGASNVYFWYYSTLALFVRGGSSWRTWNDALKSTLLPAQADDGSWAPVDLYARRYALDDEDEKTYMTTMCVLMLEVYYRYFTPLLGQQAAAEQTPPR